MSCVQSGRARWARAAQIAKNAFTRLDPETHAVGSFPMYVVPMESFMKMTSAKSHRELKDEGIVIEFKETLGHAMFVSHQWAGFDHPDPQFQQLSVLQQVLRQLLTTDMPINTNIMTRVVLGYNQCILPQEWREKPLLIWYDYFSIPQLEVRNPSVTARDLQNAVDSIPTYVKMSRFFVLLAPSVQHADTLQLMGKRSWLERGWCRLERVACAFLKPDSKILEISSAVPKHLRLMPAFSAWMRPAGMGCFTVEEDREKVLQVTKEMLHTKLLSLLEDDDIHNYRLLLNMQHLHLKMKTEGTQPSLELADFMEMNAFQSLKDRQFGWSPICFAVLRNDVPVVREMLRLKANVNDKVHRSEPSLHLEKGMSLLHLAAQFQCNGALQLLIDAKAALKKRDVNGCNALHRAGLGDNAEGVRLLLAAGSNPHELELMSRSNALLPACAWDNTQSIEAFLRSVKDIDVSFGLHFASLGEGGPEVISLLLAAGADINERLFPPLSLRIKFEVTLRLLRILQHRYSYIASNVIGSTPLLCSLVMEAYDSTALLLAANADVHIRNAGGKSPLDVAEALQAPEAIRSALHGNQDSCCQFVSQRSAERLWISM